MTLHSVDTVIVGAGVMGAATAHALARRGREVVVLERFEVGHTRGSSHGDARIFRLSYDEPSYVKMAIEALPLWRGLEEAIGIPLLTMTGGLDVGPSVPVHVAALRAHGVAFEVLDGAEAAGRFPVRFQAGERVLYQADAGVIAAGRAVRGLLDAAGRAGAELHEHERVIALRPSAAHIDVESERTTYRARVCVVTVGAWVRGLVGPAGIDLPVTPTRETPAYFPLPAGLIPPALVDWITPPTYALAGADGHLKAAEHHVGPPTDPEEDGVVNQASVARLRSWVRRRFPDAEADPVRAEACLYTNTEDESFILERHGPLVIGSPCSGHGFKFAPVIGERLADLAG